MTSTISHLSVYSSWEVPVQVLGYEGVMVLG